MRQLLNISFFAIFLFSIVSCNSLSPYKVPVYQGNIFEDEDLDELEDDLNNLEV